jgi:hypothetical protein
LRRVEVWRGGVRLNLSVFRLFRLAVPHEFDRDFRFHTPLIEPDRQVSRIRLSDKTHAFVHGRSRSRAPRCTSPKCS